MRLNCGKLLGRGALVSSLTAAFVLASGFTPESTVEAGYLKNGARPAAGDRLRTMRPPPPGTRNRILAPGEHRATRGASQPRARQQHAWFWKVHTAEATAASSARWEAALETMSKRRSGDQPIYNPQDLLAIRTAYGPDIAAAAGRHRISEALVVAVITVESRGKLKAVSPKGAQGLMQLIPATAQRFGVADPFDSAQNIGGGVAYLDWLLSEFRGDVLLALAGYNAGEGAVRRHKGVPPFAETRDYVVKVMDAVAALRPYCTEAPASPRAACHWRPGDV